MTAWAAIGAAHLDRIARSEGPVALGSSNPAEVATSPGGVARNVAENLVRLGNQVRLISRVGADEAGRSVLAATRAAGVDVSEIEIVAGASTAGYTALLDPAGGLVVAFADMAIYDGFDGAWAAEAADGVPHWFVDANLPARALVDLAAGKPPGTFLAADAVSVAKSERLRAVFPALDLIFANRDEARALAATGDLTEAAGRLRSAGTGAVIITLGADGALVADASGCTRLPPEAATVRDVTGAGDALIGATLDGLARGRPLLDATRLGVVAATLTLGYEGAVGAPPTKR
ncbi:MAG: carbohydrate kinase family protein [Hyphomicrobiaceae bacterium]|nr:carbohydrate kinase family protein [Hyphomicrobiaceae bacterium]